jgi:hypothetical protein
LADGGGFFAVANEKEVEGGVVWSGGFFEEANDHAWGSSGQGWVLACKMAKN